MTAAPPPPAREGSAAARPGGSRPEAKATPSLPFGRDDLVLALVVLNLVGLVGLGVRVYRGDRPTVVTVGITQLAREYMAKLATSNVSPAEARIRTELFLAVAQDAVKRAAGRKGILVVPRECILAGEYGDMTAEVSKAVNATLDRKTPGAPGEPARTVFPLAGMANVAP